MELLPANVPIVKRAFDLIMTFILLIIIFPLLICVIIILLMVQGKPIFYTQPRPGLNNKLFNIYKFRTMTNARDQYGDLLPDKNRITMIGKLLRASSLDELPELINIIRGEMSLVGPRPLLVQYLDRYSPEQIRRHSVLPGITGWAQVNGRNELGWNEKFCMDVWYVDNWSFLLDLKILLKTPYAVLSRKGINQPGFATAEEFMGNEKSNKNNLSDR